MSNRTIYTRTYSANSPRRLVSGKGLQCSTRLQLSDQQLLAEFSNHSNKWCPEPTALVSVSTRIIDTVQRAFAMMYYETDNCSIHAAKATNDPEDILIVFIEVPDAEHAAPVRIHEAQSLAKKSGVKEVGMFKYERLFEWEIPQEYVLHGVSLQMLLDRGIGGYILQSPSRVTALMQHGLWDHNLQEDQPLPPSSAKTLKYCIREDIESDPWGEGGLYLGFFAKSFGYRAPFGWIAYRLFVDCRPHGISFSTLKDDVDQVFVWWLEDDTCDAPFKAWELDKEAMEDCIIWNWIDFWEKWYGKGSPGDCQYECISDEMDERERERGRLIAQERKYRAGIEADAITLGLWSAKL
ncbi:hypothetical protein GE09DRAFT_355713 [Coniochaeta sp. 2T2.1]|nr:hypothetical protein GE09DRAFT_355713 [Coniochaeta sp. 2T2.1]